MFHVQSPSQPSLLKSLNIDYLDISEKDKAKFARVGKIVIAGDVNTRTRVLRDFIEDDDDIYLPLADDYKIDSDILTRNNLDETVCPRGATLTNICIRSGIRILNGRVTGDWLGQLTCHKPRESSTVDYFLASQELLQSISFFHVDKFNADLSDHCQNSLMLKVHCDNLSRHTKLNLSPLPVKYKWENSSAKNFTEVLNSQAFKMK